MNSTLTRSKTDRQPCDKYTLFRKNEDFTGCPRHMAPSWTNWSLAAIEICRHFGSFCRYKGQSSEWVTTSSMRLIYTSDFEVRFCVTFWVVNMLWVAFIFRILVRFQTPGCKNPLQKRTAKPHCKNAMQKRTAKFDM